jgi:hypothetical protein
LQLLLLLPWLLLLTWLLLLLLLLRLLLKQVKHLLHLFQK